MRNNFKELNKRLDERELEIERLNNIINEIKEDIRHELYGHILQNDEVSWNFEYYTNDKLDYRKLLIGLLEQILEKLDKIERLKEKHGDFNN